MPVGRRILIVLGPSPAADAYSVAERKRLVAVERSVEPDLRDMLRLSLRRHVVASLAVADEMRERDVVGVGVPHEAGVHDDTVDQEADSLGRGEVARAETDAPAIFLPRLL